MKIKEIEELTGLSRENVRFYEKQGLLNPLRGENGYRGFTKEDVITLKRIKFLRSLNLSLEEIKAIHNQSDNLKDTLSKKINALDNQKNSLEVSSKVCKKLIDHDVEYSDLDVDLYLNDIDNQILNSDVIPQVKEPVRRFIARLLDLTLYYSLIVIVTFISPFIDLNYSETKLVTILMVISLLIMLIVEPLFISLFGTTPGKSILGLYIKDIDENKLTYSKAIQRTAKVLIYGMAFNIPIIGEYCLYKSYLLCMNENLSWDKSNIVSLKDKKGYRYVLSCVLLISLSFTNVFCTRTSMMPVNKGELTVSAFSYNFNTYADNYGFEDMFKLDRNGNWDDGTYASNVDSILYPDLQFRLSNQNIQEISFSTTIKNTSKTPPNYQDIMSLIVVSYMKAQDSYSIF